VGMPAKVKKTLAEGELSPSPRIARHYLGLARQHKLLTENEDL
jgi:hypothetical protein